MTGFEVWIFGLEASTQASELQRQSQLMTFLIGACIDECNLLKILWIWNTNIKDLFGQPQIVCKRGFHLQLYIKYVAYG